MAHVPENNKYYVLMNCSGRTVLDLNNGSTDNGTKAQGWDFNYYHGNGNATWQLEQSPEFPDYYYIRNQASGTYLDMNNGDKSFGTKVQGWTKASKNGAEGNQLWKFHAATGAGKTIVKCWYVENKASGTNLNLTSNTNGTAVTGWGRAESTNLMWMLIPTDDY